MTDPTDTSLAGLARLVGEWTTEATHPAVRGTVVQGTTTLEWMRGEKFLVVTARIDHPDFPDAISIIGDMSRDRVGEGDEAPTAAAPAPGLAMHYYDERGVHRVFAVTIADDTWQIWNDAQGFAQRFVGTFVDGGNRIVGLWRLSRDNKTWDDDLRITYRRRRAR